MRSHSNGLDLSEPLGKQSFQCCLPVVCKHHIVSQPSLPLGIFQKVLQMANATLPVYTAPCCGPAAATPEQAASLSLDCPSHSLSTVHASGALHCFPNILVVGFLGCAAFPTLPCIPSAAYFDKQPTFLPELNSEWKFRSSNATTTSPGACASGLYYLLLPRLEPPRHSCPAPPASADTWHKDRATRPEPASSHVRQLQQPELK